MNYLKNFEPEFIVLFSLGLFVLIVFGFFIIKKIIKHKKPGKFRQQWRELQKKLPDQTQWPQALIEADDLLKDALAKKKIKGKTTGEMLVKAEKTLSDKDEVWFGHKLRKKIEANPKVQIDKKEIVRALVGLRQGIKDLGAFDGKR